MIGHIENIISYLSTRSGGSTLSYVAEGDSAWGNVVSLRCCCEVFSEVTVATSHRIINKIRRFRIYALLQPYIGVSDCEYQASSL